MTATRPIPVLGMQVKYERNVIGLFLKINLSSGISMKRSRRELSIDMVICRGVYENNQITLFPCFTLITSNRG